MKKELYYKILSTFVLIILLLLNIAPFSINAFDFGSSVNILEHVVGYNIDWIQYNGEHYSSGNKTYGISNNNGTPIAINLSNFDNSYSTYIIQKITFLFDNDYLGYVNIKYNDNQTRSVAINSNKAEFTINTQLYNCSLIGGSVYSYPKDSIMWSFPIESLGFSSYLFGKNYELKDLANLNTYYYPIFFIPKNNYIFDLLLVPENYTSASGRVYNGKLDLYFYVNQDIWQAIAPDYFQSNADMYVEIVAGKSFKYGNENWSFLHVSLTNKGNSNITAYLKALKDIKVIPIFYYRYDDYSVSTDFALLYGLNNDFLDNINIIANGSQESNNSVNSANSTNQSLSQEGEKVEQIESQLVNDFDSAMNNINVDSPLNILGSGFVQSANWIRTQFDFLTTNTPFGTLITFSLILGIGLLIIGKAFG